MSQKNSTRLTLHPSGSSLMLDLHIKGKKTKEVVAFIPGDNIDSDQEGFVDIYFCQKNTKILIEMTQAEFLEFSSLVRQEAEAINSSIKSKNTKISLKRPKIRKT